MKNMTKKATRLCVLAGAAAAVACLALVLCGCSSGSNSSSTATSSSSSSGMPSELGLADMDFEYTDRDLKGTWDDSSATHIALLGTSASSDSTSGVTVSGATVTITKEGTYVLSGSLDEGQVVVETDSETKVQLVLNGVSISNSTGPSIYVKQADKVFLTLAEDSVNTLSDNGSGSYAFDDADEPDAVLFSKDDLTINGSGSLAVDASFAHGIKSKDDLVITGGQYVITATTDALRGKDCVKICDGSFLLTAGSDAIQSSNDSDETRGFVSIDGGSFTIVAADDGIQAYTCARVMDGTLDITAGDDAIHSDTAAYVAGGTLSINAVDDAVHAETALVVDGGSLDIAACYEGLEAEKVYCYGGSASIVASDDGINAASAEASTGGEESEFMNNGGQPKAGMMEMGGAGMSDENCLIKITGGTWYVDSEGDSLDSNGYVEISGGTVLCNGPSGNDNSAFDYDLEATISGGTVLMVGATGMAQNFTSGTQAFIYANVSGKAGAKVSITDSSGNEIISITATKAFGVVQASAPSMTEGGTYKVVVDGTATQATASTTASSGFGGMGQGGSPMGPGQGGDIMIPQGGGQQQGGMGGNVGGGQQQGGGGGRR